MGSNTANQGLGRATNSKKDELMSKYNTEPRLINIMNSTIKTELSGITIISNNSNSNSKKKKKEKKKEKENLDHNETEPDLPIVKNSNIPNINFGSEATISQNRSKFKDNEENRPGPSNMTSNIHNIKHGGRRPTASENSKHNGASEPDPSSNPVTRLDIMATAFEKQKKRSNKINNGKKNKLANINNRPNKKSGGKATKTVKKKQQTSKNGGKENKVHRKKLGKAKKKNDVGYRKKLNIDVAVLEQLRNIVTEPDLCDYPLAKMIRLESIARPFHMTPPLCILIDLHGCNRVKAQSLLTAFQSLEPLLKYTPRVRFVTGTASTRERPAVLRPLVVKFLNQAFPSRQKYESAAFIDLEILGEGPSREKSGESKKKTHKAKGKEARVQNNDKSNGNDKGTSKNKEPSVYEPPIKKTSTRSATDTDAKRGNVKKNLKKLVTFVRRICKSAACLLYISLGG